MSSQPVRTRPRTPTEPSPAAFRVLMPGAVLTVPTAALTLQGFQAWIKSDDVPEKSRLTFIDQQVMIDMSGEDIAAHVLLKTALNHALYQLNLETNLGVFFIDGVLITNEGGQRL